MARLALYAGMVAPLVAIVVIAVLSLYGGDATFCDRNGPISEEQIQSLSQEAVSVARNHNRLGQELCGWPEN